MVLTAQRSVLTEEQVSKYRSWFILEPLELGFGYTLGNSMRRTLLSSIPGATVTSVRIDEVLHEFSMIAGVKEDIADIILNLKELVVPSENDELVLAYLYEQGPGEVTAADITPPAGAEVHNPDLHIATLNDKGKIKIDLIVECGRDYVSAAQNKREEDEISRVPIDSIYSPILRVSYKVGATRVARHTDFDKLTVDTEVKPSMTPRDALASAGRTLVELFGLCVELNNEVEGIELGPPSTVEAQSSDPQRPIMILNLPAHSQNRLQREGVRTIDELIRRFEASLLDIRNFGAKSIEDVKDELLKLDLRLKDSPVGFVSSFGEENYMMQFSDNSQG